MVKHITSAYLTQKLKSVSLSVPLLFIAEQYLSRGSRIIHMQIAVDCLQAKIAVLCFITWQLMWTGFLAWPCIDWFKRGSEV